MIYWVVSLRPALSLASRATASLGMAPSRPSRAPPWGSVLTLLALPSTRTEE